MCVCDEYENVENGMCVCVLNEKMLKMGCFY